MTTINFILAFVGASGVIIWLGKLIIEKSFDIGIEKYKAELVKDIEKHKSDLSKITLEHQIVFSKLHEQRAEKIKFLYRKVMEVEKALRYSTTPAQGGEEFINTDRENEVLNEILSLTELLDSERIYFSESTIAKIDTIIKESSDIRKEMWSVRFSHKQYGKLVRDNQQVPDSLLKNMNKWSEVDERVESQFKILKLELANEFRSLLGTKIN